MNGTGHSDDEASPGFSVSPDISDNEGDEGEDHGGDYSTRFEELMSDTEGDGHDEGAEEEEEEEEGFFYSGVDSNPTGDYREQLRDVLGSDHEDEVEEQIVERSLLQEVEDNEKFAALMEDEAKRAEVLSDHTPSSSVSRSRALSPLHMTNDGVHSPPMFSRPFLHPSISRLRSATPQTLSAPSSNSLGTLHSHMRDGVSAPASHFSALSRTPSSTDLATAVAQSAVHSQEPREVFRWSDLRQIGDHLYAKQSQKTSAVLGAQYSGSPTVLAANGLICVGTDAGRVLVFDFKQNLKCICGNEPVDKAIGPVTALALSFDHTFVAVGHASGHIQLFDINAPKSPARFVPPVSITVIASGRQEGHLPGSRIVSIGFIAGRHTAIVSADDSGLAFYHSLGKVLFVDATDILRILGKYPEDELAIPSSGLPTAISGRHFHRRKQRKANTILAMGPLPLGPSSHPTDAYNLIALLTPVKLVIVGLKPSPKTWYRRHRENDDDISAKSRFKGTLAWYPSVAPNAAEGSGVQNGKHKQANGAHSAKATSPMLIYSWGNSLNLIKVSESKIMQEVRNAKTGKVSKTEIGRVVFEEVGRWSVESDILAVQWLNHNQVLVLTTGALEVHDVQTMKIVEREAYDAWSLVSPILSHTTNGAVSYHDAVAEVSHSIRVYKGKIFVLGQHEVQVGTLLTWADRILTYVQKGDFLSAIELTRSYYVGEAPGNRNGLPDDPAKLKQVVGEKMIELMEASARYAFSEDRMSDETHFSADGRGVDRTSLFEGLVATCARACIALDDYDFLFEDLFQYYDNNAIASIFLLQLEPFVLNSDIRHIPPRITQRLIAMHHEDKRSDLVERVIWHIDPDCLDIQQAIHLCQAYQLYDALVYIFTRAIKDYVLPVVEFLGLIRKVQRFRRSRLENSPTSTSFQDDENIEKVAMNAYKIYPYLGNVLTGLTYPSGEPLPAEEAFQAKNSVYTFLFFGRSSMWPLGEGGKLILTSDEENGVEPTYPYARLLLRFDAEAFLHTLDLAFEDAYLNDESRGVSRLVIVKILLEILSSPDLSSAEKTFVNIFVARNVPKYPQFIQIPPSALHNILIALAEDPDPETREDRQLAAEYLLSAYTPHGGDRIIPLFEKAGFYRILRTWHKQEKQWSSLLLTYLQDPEVPAAGLFESANEVLKLSKRSNKGKLPLEVINTVVESLSTLLNTSVANTAALIDAHMPELHDEALEALGEESGETHFAYLHYLLGPPSATDEMAGWDPPPPRRRAPSSHLSPALRELYVALHCKLDPARVIASLEYLLPDFLDTEKTIQTCEDAGVYDAVIWLQNRAGSISTALAKAEAFDKILSTRLAEALVSPSDDRDHTIEAALAGLESINRIAVTICLQRSTDTSFVEVPLEDIWFQLLRSQIDSVQRVASCCSSAALVESDQDNSEEVQLERKTLSVLRSLVQKTFGTLMSVNSSKALSFPRLFKRLVESAASTHLSKGTLYTEFRTILTGMLESFRSEGDMLIITKHLVDRDLFETIEELTQDRLRGWAPSQAFCGTCHKRVLEQKKQMNSGEPEDHSGSAIVVSRTGIVYHSRCLPSDLRANASTVH